MEQKEEKREGKKGQFDKKRESKLTGRKEKRRERAAERRLNDQAISTKDITSLVQQNAQERAENDPLITVCAPPSVGEEPTKEKG